MKTVHKFELFNTDVQTISMPRGSRLLTVQLQKGKYVLWAMVTEIGHIPHSATPLLTEEVVIYRELTGWVANSPDNTQFIATCQDGGFVTHWFALVKVAV